MHYKVTNDDCNDKYLLHSEPNYRSSRKIQINEWSFSLSLFIVSLAIVTGKIILIYADDIPSKVENNSSRLIEIKNHLNDIYNLPNFLVMTNIFYNNQYTNETLFNSEKSDENKNVVIQTVQIFDKFGRFIRATLSGLGILGFTWFIVYKDSNIPGINPPSPFSPKIKLLDNSKIQMNYIIGILNAILIFIYMNLQ